MALHCEVCFASGSPLFIISNMAYYYRNPVHHHIVLYCSCHQLQGCLFLFFVHGGWWVVYQPAKAEEIGLIKHTRSVGAFTIHDEEIHDTYL